ncbi:ribosome-recycling factor, mitochondrial [Anopheles ziemanni]|uniref:ribosome-recycling factor, mitochondrial n=1 Tax=Anopheles coustani TaxID=139045 RepID=UPI0026584321|nr:ribosome-recycling factor, mitochondrial [Anopheles coustani]XP_058168202.1 ribosome-recycling factor, mitochondrial [Anopheles ziemanni]
MLRITTTLFRAVNLKQFDTIFCTVGASKCVAKFPPNSGFVFPASTQSVRYYAKGKDKKKDKKGTTTKVQINEEQLTSLINLEGLRTQMEKSLTTMKEDYAKNLSLRSTTGSIETLRITYEGKDYQLQELGQVVRKNPKTIVVNLISFPQTIPAVLQAIQRSGMNLNPQQDGTTLFIPVPKVTREHREGLARNAKALYIKCRDRIKDAQNQSIKKLKKQPGSGVSEDDAFQAQAQITAIAEGFIKEAEKIMESKQSELLGDK